MRALYALLALVLLPLAAPEAAAQPRANLELVADGFVNPLTLAEPPDGTGRLFVVDQPGQIWVVTADGERLGEPFLDLSDRVIDLNEHYDERGLLGLAFHPDYAENGRFFVFYSVPLREQALDTFNHTNRISEFHVSDGDPNVADVSSERVLIENDHPYMNHNAGTLAFGPEDGMLYVSLGDGGHRDDQDMDFVPGHVEDWYDVNIGGNGQDIENNLLGSILRLDVDAEAGEEHDEGGAPYTVPEDNPFAGIPGVKGEVWAYGFRNPYRFSFDMGGDHDLIAGDAGQNLYEEVSLVTKGGNYGWNVMEGRHCFNAASPTEPFATCPDETGVGHPVEGDPLIAPVIEAKNAGLLRGRARAGHRRRLRLPRARGAGARRAVPVRDVQRGRGGDGERREAPRGPRLRGHSGGRRLAVRAGPVHGPAGRRPRLRPPRVRAGPGRRGVRPRLRHRRAGGADGPGVPAGPGRVARWRGSGPRSARRS